MGKKEQEVRIRGGIADPGDRELMAEQLRELERRIPELVERFQQAEAERIPLTAKRRAASNEFLEKQEWLGSTGAHGPLGEANEKYVERLAQRNEAERAMMAAREEEARARVKESTAVKDLRDARQRARTLMVRLKQAQIAALVDEYNRVAEPLGKVLTEMADIVLDMEELYEGQTQLRAELGMEGTVTATVCHGAGVNHGTVQLNSVLAALRYLPKLYRRGGPDGVDPEGLTAEDATFYNFAAQAAKRRPAHWMPPADPHGKEAGEQFAKRFLESQEAFWHDLATRDIHPGPTTRLPKK